MGHISAVRTNFSNTREHILHFNSGSKRSEYFIIFFTIAFSPFVIDRKKMVSAHIKNKKSYEILRTIRVLGCIEAESKLCTEEAQLLIFLGSTCCVQTENYECKNKIIINKGLHNPKGSGFVINNIFSYFSPPLVLLLNNVFNSSSSVLSHNLLYFFDLACKAGCPDLYLLNHKDINNTTKMQYFPCPLQCVLTITRVQTLLLQPRALNHNLTSHCTCNFGKYSKTGRLSCLKCLNTL